MTDFLLELRSEEIPARMQAGARASLEKLFREQMAAAAVTLGAITVWSTPRRLALIARGLPDATEAVSEEVKGPKTSAPPQALEGFLRKTGLTQDQLTTRDGVFFAITQKPGRATRDVLAEAIPAIIRAFPWPKSQRWGAASITTESLRWVRPLSGIVAIFGDELVECEIGGITSGYATLGHRFHAPGEITIGGAADYQDKLRACYVIVDHAEREAIIREGAKAAASAAGLVLVEDEGLVIENAGLTEWPVPLLGRFDAEYLEVPSEVIQLTARTNQKYFVCEEGGKLANAFICTANVTASDGGAAIVAGNRKVLAARLSDARFFWQQDRKKTLAKHAEGLSRITFHEKLGTVADKVERVAKLAKWLCEKGIVKSSSSLLGEGDRSPQASGGGAPPSAANAPATSPSKLGEDQARLAVLAEQAAYLCKADLVTEMVGEFPELQGLMGSYYARAEGLPEAVCDAIRDHYKPVGQGDDVPTAPVTVAVALADKLDTLAGFFSVGLLPTGSKDPFALRRQMLGIINIVEANRLLLPYFELAKFARNLIVKTFGANKWVTPIEDEIEDVHQPEILDIDDSRVEDGVVVYPYGANKYTIDDSPDTLVWTEDYDRATHPPVTFQSADDTARELTKFMLERFRVKLRDDGLRHDVVDSLIRNPMDKFAKFGKIRLVELSGQKNYANESESEPTDNLLYIRSAAHSLNEVLQTQAGEDALYSYRRLVRFLDDAIVALTDHHAKEIGAPEEMLTLSSWIDELEGKLAAARTLRNIASAVEAIASGRGVVDAFCDNVTVNDADPAKRAARLALLAQFRSAVHQVADFSKIEG